MINFKAKHGKRRYKYGGGSIIDTLKTIVTSPFAQKLALAAVTGVTKGLVQSQLNKKRTAEPTPNNFKSDFPASKKQKQLSTIKNQKEIADKVINGKGIVFD